ncbi:MAG TPA: Gfo/Idh/MocA family oxidoreductase [Armatimonadota bacterium]|nr:Gfo/Idh/MocA family oxidoreductase [Armatimonadota bacterium]
MDRPVRIGIIGTGGISNEHVRCYKQIPEVEIVAVADIMPGRAEEAAKRWEAPRFYTSHKQLLAKEDLDGVSVCTPNKHHRQPSIDALRAGVHVMVEKPLAYSANEGLDMIKAARETGKMLTVGIQSRYGPDLQLARRVVESGQLGDIYYAETVGTRRRGIPGGSFIRKETAGGGAVVDIGVYSLDSALYVMGHPEPVAVSAVTQDIIGKTSKPIPGSWHWDPEKMEVEEFGAAWIRFKNDAVLMFKISWAVHLKEMGKTFFLGTQAGLSMGPLEVFRDEWGALSNTTFDSLPRVDAFLEKVRAFVKAIQTGGPTPIPAEQLYLTNVIMDGIYQSAQKGGREVALKSRLDELA